MGTAIHIELDILCLLILGVIAYQSIHNINQQTKRILFRNVVFGVGTALVLDILWLLVEGRLFPGAIHLNRIINALFLGGGVTIGCMWYLYVLETLGYKISRAAEALILTPGIVFILLNLISIRTEWIFSVSPENIYSHGPLFWVQMIGAYGMLFVSLFHIMICLFTRKDALSRMLIRKLLLFYIIPVTGALASIPFIGMPGTWTCAAISIVLIYIDDLDNEILRDGLTGLNNRKTLDAAFAGYTRQIPAEKQLYLFMIDLDNFKQINDSLGHTTGDSALKAAASILAQTMADIKGIIVRYGGDEFLIMTLFDSRESALGFKTKIQDAFEDFSRTHPLPYRLTASIGFASYKEKMELKDLVHKADMNLYADKRQRKDAASQA